MLPNPDMETTKRLMGEAGVNGPKAVGELSASIMSANVAFMVGTMGPDQTATVLRDWAATVQRKSVKAV